MRDIFFKKVNVPGKYQDDNAIPTLINYIMRSDKTPSGIKGGYCVDLNDIAGSMIAVSEKFGKNSKIRLHHFIISFSRNGYPGVRWIPTFIDRICTPISQRYQIAYAFHEDTLYRHIHFAFNAVSYVDGYKYHNSETDYRNLIRLAKHAVMIDRHYNFRPVNHVPMIGNPDE